ncbi:methyltransferase domain-containing protein [Acetobacterium fimetarium]|uniref:Methyltransferase domain-containing protein n=1 Tax=Acetobacterium fimetarium TaxID=52691 RepID=A0ABR6WR54_9FIRM|nr:class I SAM-dependent methyltransferase [Acetobacterium fimetarium]MBC3803103.1 methyltransferase domain-containing protein [Acetobacterium fimetarium]
MLRNETANATLKNMVVEQWDHYAPKYTTRVGYHLSSDLKEAWKKELSRATDNRHNLKVLDVGTGPGFIAMLFEELGQDCIGVDFSEEMIKAARKESKKNHSSCSFIQADAEALPFDDESFDVVTNRHVIWTLTDPQKAMIEWVRVLKPGGRLIIFEGDWVEGQIKGIDRIRKQIGTKINNRHKSKQDSKDRTKTGKFDEIKQKLPLRRVTKEKVVRLMKNVDIRSVHNQDIGNLIRAEIKARPLGYKLTYNRNRFMVVGEKSDSPKESRKGGCHGK